MVPILKYLTSLFNRISNTCWERSTEKTLCCAIFNRPGVAGAVLQTRLLLLNSLIQSVNDPFPQNLHNIITPKP